MIMLKHLTIKVYLKKIQIQSPNPKVHGVGMIIQLIHQMRLNLKKIIVLLLFKLKIIIIKITKKIHI